MKSLRPLPTFILAEVLLLPGAALALPRPSGLEQISGIILSLVVAITISIVLYPYIYRLTLKKKGGKDLSRFLLNDPKTRDLLLQSRGIKPKAKNPAPPNPPAGNPPTDPPPDQ